MASKSRNIIWVKSRTLISCKLKSTDPILSYLLKDYICIEQQNLIENCITFEDN
jgi:hypothetical protein